MIDPFAALAALGVSSTDPFPVTSRYHGSATATFNLADGRQVVYLRRRFVPSADRFTLLQTYVVTQGDRLDNIAAEFLGDPEQFWRLCDANNALRPEELTDTLGRPLRITLPEGIPGAPHA
ncbi:MAG TPA: LysM domain-containing protein [Isosphaeraceae bacterium]|jgi:hypothetical protein|nr:LysM domain-containing protein [Isosphaeraceae bacterium]